MREAMLKMMHPVNPSLGNFISCAKSVPQHHAALTSIDNKPNIVLQSANATSNARIVFADVAN